MTDQRPTVDPETGMHKYDQQKPRVELLPARVLEDVAEILTFGAEKYEDHNWRKGTKWSRFYGAALRHLLAWSEGEDFDPESGLPHLAHALCCIMFLQEYSHSEAGEDDRWDTLTAAIDKQFGHDEPRLDEVLAGVVCDHCTKPAGTYDGIDGGRPACVCDTSCRKDICRVKVDPESTDQIHAGDYGKDNSERNPRAWRDDNFKPVPTAIVNPTTEE